MQLFHGTVVATPTTLTVHTDAILLVTATGHIQSLEANASVERRQQLVAQHGLTPDSVHVLTPTQFLLPGFIDTHIHAPQYPIAGTALNLPLLSWLTQHTFPTESQLSNLDTARHVYNQCVRRTLRNGTTTAAYFATLHTEASCILMDVMHERGQRGWVGKVCMTQNSPPDYSETEAEAISATIALADYAQSKGGLVEACVTPRFAPSCTQATLTQLSDLAKVRNLPVQSHLSETTDEVNWVQQLFPESTSYSNVYDAASLLTPRTVMGHCIHLTQSERELLRARGVGVAHCPNSNFTLRSGILNVRQLLEEGNKVALGTDVSGGYAPSMLDAIRQASIASRVVEMRDPAFKHLSTTELLYLATQGGADAMGLGDRVGSLEPGKEFDALLVDVAAPDGPIDIFSGDTIESMLEKFLFLGDDRNILQVFVRGQAAKRM